MKEKSDSIKEIELKRYFDDWIENGLLAIDVDGYFVYKFDVNNVFKDHLDMDLFFRIVRHEISELLCEDEDKLPDYYFKPNGELSHVGVECFDHLHKHLAQVIAEEIWPALQLKQGETQKRD